MLSIEYLRSFRIGGYAVFDFTVSYIGVYLLAPYLSKMFKQFGVKINKAQWLYLTLPLAVFVHLLFGQKTPLTVQLMEPRGYYVLKLVILGMIYKGITLK